jgi:hypothetical protein
VETSDILDIEETDPRKIIVGIDRAIRPEISATSLTSPSTSDLHNILSYARSIQHAYRKFGLDFPINIPNEIDYSSGPSLYTSVKNTVENLKIDILYEKVQRGAVIQLDETWRSKIHTYLQHIRQIVEKTEMDVDLRDRILNGINYLAAEVDRSRAPLQKFTDTLVQLCEGVSEGAEALNPAVKLFERIIGAIVRLKTAAKPPLALPKPEDFGLGEVPQIEDKTGQ